MSHLSRCWCSHRWLQRKFWFNVPECEMSINSRVNPTTIISNSVYANQEAIEKTGTGARQAFIEKHKHRQKNMWTYVGNVTLSK